MFVQELHIKLKQENDEIERLTAINKELKQVLKQSLHSKDAQVYVMLHACILSCVASSPHKNT